MAYSKKVVDKFENTLNNPEAYKVGRFDPKELNVGTGMVGAPACGDVMKLQIKCEPKGNSHIIKDVKFKTYGCGSAIASSSTKLAKIGQELGVEIRGKAQAATVVRRPFYRHP